MKKKLIAVALAASLFIGTGSQAILNVSAEEYGTETTDEGLDQAEAGEAGSGENLDPDQNGVETPDSEAAEEGTDVTGENQEQTEEASDDLNADPEENVAAESGNEEAEDVSDPAADAEISVASENAVTGRQVININEGWSFSKNDASSEGWSFPQGGESGTVNLPHTWEYVHPTMSYIPAYNSKTVTYEKQLDVQAYQGKNLFIKFYGSGRNTQVFVDGTEVGTHVGGYTAFVFDLTPYITGKSTVRLTANVTNMDTVSIPINVDYTQWAGIYRDVELIATDNQYISLEDYGSTGLYIDSLVSGNNATVSLRAKVSNKAAESVPVTVKTEIYMQDGSLVTNGEQVVSLAGNQTTQEVSVSANIPNVHLWNGTSDPYLYVMKVTLLDKEKNILDEVSENFGVRTYKIQSGKSYLNGAEYEVHGVGYHQDREGCGNATNVSQKEADINLMLNMGVNAVRTAHYPHDQSVYDLADQKGLLIYNEIPYYLLYSKAESYQKSIRDQLREMIRQGYNHPSIVMWGILNEVYYDQKFAQFGDDFNISKTDMINFNKNLVQLAKSEDKTRCIVQANIDTYSSAEDTAKWSQDIDLTGLNLYEGFKSPVSSAGDEGRKNLISSLNSKLDQYKTIFGADSLMISEYGAGANINQHTEVDESFSWDGNASGDKHYEEYQSFVLEAYLDMIQGRDDIPASFVWNMFDFSCYRNEGGMTRTNTKGLVCYDHATKKDAYYLFKANWNQNDKFVWLTGKRFTQRSQTVQDIKAYSNCEKVELFVNGKSAGYGKKQQSGVFVWKDVQLSGNNSLKVVAYDGNGTQYTDEASGIEVTEKDITYQVHVSNLGWLNRAADGEETGNANQQIEAVSLKCGSQLGNCKIQYRVYVDGEGWQAWKTDGETSGTVGQGKKIRAIQMKLTGADANKYDIYYATSVSGEGWNDWATSGVMSGNLVTSQSLNKLKVVIQKKGTAAPGATSNPELVRRITYQAHVENIGWQETCQEGQTAGTSGMSYRLEGIKINLKDAKYSGSVQYRTHIQNIGWQGWKKDGQLSGTTGQHLRLEAVEIKLTGEMAEKYDIYYRVHAQNYGWLDWAKNGERAGTAGYGYRLEALEIQLVNKGGAAPGATANPYYEMKVAYQVHVQNTGDQGYRNDGDMAGTEGQSLRLEGIRIKLPSSVGKGSIQYSTHVQNIGWQGWKSDDALAGTTGQSLRLEAIRIRLTGKMAEEYDVYYQVHAQNYGWLDWAKNGENAGTAGYAYRLEGIRIVLVEKGGDAPGSTKQPFYQK